MDNNVKCGVIRDLLPLVVDEVASADSVELVNAHMEECEGCRGYYQGMTTALARTSSLAPEADKAFIKLGRKIKLQTNLRKWLTRALAGLLAIIVILLGYAFVDRKSTYYNVDMDPDWADVQLYYEPNGTIGARIDMKDGHGWYNCMQMWCMDGILYLAPMRPEWTFLNKGNSNGENMPLHEYYWQDGGIVERRNDYREHYNPETNLWESEVEEIIRPVRTVRWGTMQSYTTLYVEGEEIPSVYEVMNEADRNKPVLLTGVSKTASPDRVIIVQEEASADENKVTDGEEALRGAVPENPAKGNESP